MSENLTPPPTPDSSNDQPDTPTSPFQNPFLWMGVVAVIAVAIIGALMVSGIGSKRQPTEPQSTSTSDNKTGVDYDKAVSNDITNGVVWAETALTDDPILAAFTPDLFKDFTRLEGTVVQIAGGAAGYCVRGWNPSAAKAKSPESAFVFNSNDGGMTPTMTCSLKDPEWVTIGTPKAENPASFDGDSTAGEGDAASSDEDDLDARGWDVSIKSDLRNAATAVEVAFTDNPTKAPTAADLKKSGLMLTPGNMIDLAVGPNLDYCIRGWNPDAGMAKDPASAAMYDSANGGVRPGGACSLAAPKWLAINRLLG